MCFKGKRLHLIEDECVVVDGLVIPPEEEQKSSLGLYGSVRPTKPINAQVFRATMKGVRKTSKIWSIGSRSMT